MNATASIPDDHKTVAPGRAANRVTHGRYIVLGALPKGCEHIRRLCNRLRRQLTDAVAALRGEVTLADSATIQTCCRFERHAQLAGRWLRENPDIPLADRLAISRDVAKASESRDRCIKALGLDKRNTPEDSLDEFYRQLRAGLPAAASPAGSGREAVHTPLALPASQPESLTGGAA